MKMVDRRTFLGLLGGAFAALSIPLKVLDPFRPGRELVQVPGAVTLKTLILSFKAPIPGQPVISGLTVARNGAERVLWKHWLNDPGAGTILEWKFRDGIRLAKHDRLIVYMHNSPVRPKYECQYAYLDDRGGMGTDGTASTES